MKIILTGSTGFIGGEVLAQCLKNPAITSAVVLSRRSLSKEISDPRLKVIIMKDFTQYPDSVIKELAGADACIWAMGSNAGDSVLEIDYPIAFAQAFASTLPVHKKKFRYLHVSGGLVEPDQEKPLWFLQNARKVRGRAQTLLVDFPKQNETGGLWETFIARPAAVQPSSGVTAAVITCLLGKTMSIRADELAVAMIDTVLNGTGSQIENNPELLERGRALLK